MFPCTSLLMYVHCSLSGQNKDSNLINRLARQVLIGGESSAMPSPCGTNCSYIVEFEGPYMECNSTTSTQLFDDAAVSFLVYSGNWTAPLANLLNQRLRYNGTYSLNNSRSVALTPIKRFSDPWREELFSSDRASINHLLACQSELYCE